MRLNIGCRQYKLLLNAIRFYIADKESDLRCYEWWDDKKEVAKTENEIERLNRLKEKLEGGS